jgi:hypothetical protein
MSIHLPEINTRSMTPMSSKTNDSKVSITKSVHSIKPGRNISLSPMRLMASRKDSHDTTINPRAFSDELHPTSIDSEFLFKKIYTITSEVQKSSKINKRPIQTIDKQSYIEVIDALLSMYNCDRSRIQAIKLVQLFVGLGYCDDCEVLFEIFKNITETQSFNMISFSRNELIKVCEDQKTENVMKRIINDIKLRPTSDKSHGIHLLINVIKRWWQKLDKSKNGFVALDEISKFYTKIGVIESISDTKRLLLKFTQFGTYKQFYSMFAKALLKYLLSELVFVVKKGNKDCLSAEIAICAQRRKVILDSLEGEKKIIDAIIECNVFNN